MANFLTPKQYAATPTGKSGTSYSSYKQWVTKTRAKRAAAGAAPTGAPNAAVQQQAMGMVQPIIQAQIKAITDQVNRSTQLGSNAIQGYGKQYLASLPAIQKQVGGIYDQANAQQGAIDKGLTDLIMGQNGAANAQMAALNAAAGGTGSGVAQVAQAGAGALGATAAYGASSASSLNRIGAAEKSYAAEMPAFGQAQIGQNMGNFLAGQQKTIADAASTAQGQLPAMLQSAYDTIYNRQYQQQQLAQQQAQFLAGEKFTASENAKDRAARAAEFKATHVDPKDPNAPFDWAGLNNNVLGTFTSLTQDVYSKDIDPKTGQLRLVRKGLTRPQMRSRIQAYVRNASGGKAWPKGFIDRVLDQMYGGAAGGKKGGSKAPAQTMPGAGAYPYGSEPYGPPAPEHFGSMAQASPFGNQWGFNPLTSQPFPGVSWGGLAGRGPVPGTSWGQVAGPGPIPGVQWGSLVPSNPFKGR